MKRWTYLILWAKGTDGWFPFDQTTPKQLTREEAASAVWKMRGLWNNYTDPVGVYAHDGTSWRLAAMQREPLKRIAER